MPSKDVTSWIPNRTSLVAETVRSLRAGVRRGEWPGLLPGERALSEQLQVSRKTLRAALAELEREGCLRGAARQRREVVTRSAPGGSPGKRRIAVLLPYASPTLLPAMAMVMEALRERLPSAGLAVEWCAERACFSARPERALERLMRAHPGAAWVVVGSKEPMQRWLVQKRVRCLILGTPLSGLELPSLDLDYRAVCRHAAGVLWRAGHRRLALVVPRDAFGGDLASEEGAADGVAALPGASLTTLRHDSPAELCRKLDALARGGVSPTGLIVAHGSAVLTALTHLLRRGQRVPEVMALISRDDDPAWSFVQPAVTHYHSSSALFARKVAAAAKQLAGEGGLSARAIWLMPEFVPGATV
jgi:DNA-binding LacI/PurR family transcriptional regulator